MQRVPGSALAMRLLHPLHKIPIRRKHRRNYQRGGDESENGGGCRGEEDGADQGILWIVGGFSHRLDKKERQAGCQFTRA